MHSLGNDCFYDADTTFGHGDRTWDDYCELSDLAGVSGFADYCRIVKVV
jgi:hypothetical protein